MAAELLGDDWARLLLCRPTPDPRVPKDVNTFVSTHEEAQPATFDGCLATFRMYEALSIEAAELGNRSLDEGTRRNAILTRIRELQRGGSLDSDQAAALEEAVEAGDLPRALRGLRDSGGLDAPSAQLLGDGCSSEALGAVGARMRALCRGLLDAATAAFLAEGQSSAYGESQLAKIGLWRSQKDARLTRADLGPGFALEVPRTVAMSALAVRLVHSAREDPAKPGGALLAVGGVVTIEIIGLPPAPKAIGNWTVEVMPGALQFLPYSVSAGQMSVTYVLPDGLHLPEGDPTFGWLDPAEQRWVPLDAPADAPAGRLEGRSATFLTAKTGQFALLYPRTRCLPYRSWKLEANAPEGGATLSLFPIGLGAWGASHTVSLSEDLSPGVPLPSARAVLFSDAACAMMSWRPGLAWLDCPDKSPRRLRTPPSLRRVAGRPD